MVRMLSPWKVYTTNIPYLQPVYAGIIVKTRELTVINMMAGQLASDVFNHVLKYTIKQERPHSEFIISSEALLIYACSLVRTNSLLCDVVFHS